MVEDILINILALDRYFRDFEFIHTFLGSTKYKRKAKLISSEMAIHNLNNLIHEIESNIEIDDVFPYYRKTYLKDLIQSVLTQAAIFIFNSAGQYNFKEKIERMYGLQLIPPFDIDKELTLTGKELNNLGFNSIPDSERKLGKVNFANKGQLKKNIHQIVNIYSQRTQDKFSAYFKYDLKEIFKASKIFVELPPENCGHPCYYYYRGGFKGSVGIRYKREMEEYYIDRFILHEIMPGHHFYYLIRQSALNQKTFDPILALDTYYSPENIINEGLALNLFSIFQDDINEAIIAQNLIENLSHKVFYNCWYDININSVEDLSQYYQVLQQEMGFSEEGAKENIFYFTCLEKYFAPSYALGDFYVKNFLQKYGYGNVAFLYNQLSVNSLKKLERGLENGGE